MLSASDKAEVGSVTGKFGLGFKSVFLVSAKPKLVSGRLAAEIVGGLCPKPLEDAQYYRDLLHKLTLKGEKRPGTLIALPLDEQNPDNLTRDFIQRAGLLCIFAKRIRRIDLEGIAASEAQWQPDARLTGGASRRNHCAERHCRGGNPTPVSPAARGWNLEKPRSTATRASGRGRCISAFPKVKGVCFSV
ncbi:hypothetical protein [Desulfobulbus oralis]|nr:hypothetical protein [Desulfobulbus oralis]